MATQHNLIITLLVLLFGNLHVPKGYHLKLRSTKEGPTQPEIYYTTFTLSLSFIKNSSVEFAVCEGWTY